MPYPKEHAARINEPEKYDKITRKNDAGGPGVDFIYGITGDKPEIQAVRFDKEKFTVDQAKKWLKDNKMKEIKFEPASGVKESGYFIKESGDRYIVFRQDVKARGKEATVLLANGVKARCITTEDDQQVILEFMFDKNKFSKESAKDWTRKYAENLDKSLQESAPKGSFVDTTLKVQQAINDSVYFPTDEYGNSQAYITNMFPDYAVVCLNGKDFKLKYAITTEGVAELEPPVEVKPEYIEESGAERHFDLEDSYANSTLKEAKFDKKSRKLVAVLIEKGINYDKKRYYPDETIREAAPLFAGIKMFIDHPTDREDREKPERSVRDEVGIIEKSWYEDGKVMGQIHIHDEWLAAKLLDDVFRENAGLSINASGRRSFKTIDGEKVEVIEKIASPRSVDWVTEAGARGRVEYLIESAKEKKGEPDMLKTVTLSEVKTERPDLYESIRREVQEEVSKENEKKITEAVDAKIKEETEKLEESKRQSDYQSKIKGLLESTKLPGASIAKLCEEFKDKTFKSEADLESKVREAATSELDYISKLGGVKLSSEKAAEGKDLRESATAKLMESVGVKVEKKAE
jgi:hypothetical protein